MARSFLPIAATALLLIVGYLTFRMPRPDSWTSSMRPFRGDSSSGNSDLQDKLKLAEKLWRQSVVDREEMITAYNSATLFPDGYVYPYNVWDYARPSFFCPHDMERVGALGDGGKVVCGMARYEKGFPPGATDKAKTPALIVYSFGVSTDSSFEAALLERTNCEIWGYDYTVASFAKDIPSHQVSRTHFSRIGISAVTDEKRVPKFYTVQDLMAANGHDYVDIVKMDIEGAEFGAMTSLISFLDSTAASGGEGVPLPFGQLLIELHMESDGPDHKTPKDLKTWMDWWAALERHGLRPVNNEDNWIGDVMSGKPRFMEYTLINVMDRQRNKILLE